MAQQSKSTIIDKVKIRKDGSYVATGTKVTTTHTGGPNVKLKPGKYKVDIEGSLDRIIDKEPLFSHLIRKLAPIEAIDTTSTSSTDGYNIFWNKDFYSAIGSAQQCAVLLHEVLHCAFLHLWRRKNRDPHLWNIACDYAINLIVNKTFPLPPGSLLDAQYTGMSAEEIYDKLPIEKVKEQGWCSKEDWDGQGGSGKGQKGAGNVIRRILGKDAAKKAAEEAAKRKAAAKSSGQKEQDWSNAFDEALTKNYGNAPEYIKRAIGTKHYVPVIDWAALVSRIVSEDITDYSFAQPDRRFLEEPFMLPELFSYDRVKDVVFAYDTSGSISADDLNAFFQETLELWGQFPNLSGWSAVCDADIQTFKEITPDSSKEEMGFKGGGGTSFVPVFDEIEKRNLHVKALFYFTDTYGSFPREVPPYPVFWLVRSYIGDPADYRLPFGQVIKFMNKSQLADPMHPPSRW